MVLFWPILAPKYEVPKLNTPKYVTLQKLTAKIEHCLNIDILRVRVMVFNGTFNNISIISWRSVLLVEETGVPRENPRQN
jgi:hypothetical protein